MKPWRAGLRGLFGVEPKPIPWGRPIGAAFTMGIPLLAALLVGRLPDGLIACFGGFAWLYLFREPYSQRARRLVAVGIGLAVAFALGMWGGSVSIWSAGVILGLVGTISFVLCELVGLPVPGPFFFVFACAVGTAMTGAPALILFRAGLVALGAVPAFLLAMAGWLWDPHGPERQVVGSAYRALGALLAAVGTDQFHAATHQATVALRTAERALPPGKVRWRRPGEYGRLVRLMEQAESLFLAIVALGGPVDSPLPAVLRALADSVADSERAACLVIPSHAGASAVLVERLQAAVAIAADSGAGEAPDVRPAQTRGESNSLWAGLVDKRSAVLPRALRLGVMLLLAHLMAYSVGAHTPYWVSVSCMAVMMGITCGSNGCGVI